MGGSARLRRRAPVRVLRLSRHAADADDPRRPRSARAASSRGTRGAGARGDRLSARRVHPTPRRSGRHRSRAGAAISRPGWLQKERRSFYTIGSAGHESNAAVALGAAPDRPRAAPLPLRRLLPRAGPRRPGATAVPTCCSASPPRSTSRSPAAATRSSATTSWRSSRRPRRSPPTCRAPSASRSRSTGRASSASRPPGRPTRSSSAASATPRPTTRRHRRAQHRRPRRPPAPAAAAAPRLRGQRPRDQRPDAVRLDRERALEPRRHLRYERRRRRSRPAALAAARELADWVRETRRPGRPPPAHRPLPRPRRHRRRGRLPHARRDPGRLAARPDPRHGAWLVAVGGADRRRLAEDYLDDARARVRERRARSAPAGRSSRAPRR